MPLISWTLDWISKWKVYFKILNCKLNLIMKGWKLLCNMTIRLLIMVSTRREVWHYKMFKKRFIFLKWKRIICKQNEKNKMINDILIIYSQHICTQNTYKLIHKVKKKKLISDGFTKSKYIKWYLLHVCSVKENLYISYNRFLIDKGGNEPSRLANDLGLAYLKLGSSSDSNILW